MFSAKFAALASTLAFVSSVAGHGMVIDPPVRPAGSAFRAACGDQPFYQVSSDPYGNSQGIVQVAGNSFDASSCNPFLCKGLQFADNTANVQSYTVGQVVPIKVEIRAPHTGFTNVSVVDTASNSIIGTSLWDIPENAYGNSGIPAEQTSFSITIPDVGDKCDKAGACVIQWYWHSPSVDQTYESCIDFTVGGSGNPPVTTPTEPEEPTETVVPTPSETPVEPVPSPSETPVEPVPSPSETPVEPVPSPSETPVVPPPVSSAPVPPVPTTTPTSPAPVPTQTQAPVPPVTKPTTTAPSTPRPTGAIKDANVCMNEYNKCIANSQPRPDWEGCTATKDACLSNATYNANMLARARRSGSYGRLLL